MESKQTLLAVVLSLIVLVGWNHFAEYMGWVEPPVAPQVQVTENANPSSVAGTQASQPSAQAAANTVDPALVFEPTQGREVTVDTPLYTAVFHSGGGILKSFVLKKYSETIAVGSPQVSLISEKYYPLASMGLTINGLPSWSAGKWAFEGSDISLKTGEVKSLTFSASVDGMLIKRVLNFDADTYLITEKLTLGGTNTARAVKVGFKTGNGAFDVDDSYNVNLVAWLDESDFEDYTDQEKLVEEGIQEQGKFSWGGVMNNYFMTTVAPLNADNLTLKARIQDGFWGVVMERDGIQVPSGGEVELEAAWWYGAKVREMLDAAPAEYASSVNLGIFTVIARPLLYLLELFHSYVNNWGIAIILLTFMIRVVFFPLSQKSYSSMEKMKKLQPQMLKLRDKYGDDKVALNREVMQLYKTYGVNPASGCLPILVQIPVFIGLYQALLNSLELRHADFIYYLPFTDITWLADLSTKDPLYITPILMGATMFLQQKLSPPMGEPIQQKIMLAMPIIFTVMFINFPSGLVVYWLFNNILSIAQQWIIMRKYR